jgi:beta-aspartyl-peptidase (threonine type)
MGTAAGLPCILVHGGAGNDFDDRLDAFRAGVRRAAEAGFAVLGRGGSALDAAEAAVLVLEDDPQFDAGYGSFLNADNEAEMDAMIMDGTRLGYGAVAGIKQVRNPIRAARLVMEKTKHSLFVGPGAEAFARSMGLPFRSAQEMAAGSSTHLLRPEHRVFRSGAAGDTVGAIALDGEGRLAVAVSTGGTAGKMPGRVGDSPLIGCGGYADDTLGAAASTGNGEALMKILVTKTACDLMGSGLSPQAAAERTIRELERRVGPTEAGLVLMNAAGDFGAAFNTNHMVHCFKSMDGRDELRD